MTVYPRHGYILTTEEFRALLCLRLGVPQPFISESTRCTCATRALIGKHGEHAHNCAKGGLREARHRDIAHVCRDMIGQAGVVAVLEPSDLFVLDDSKKRPDIIAKRLHPDSNDVIFDVQVTNPSGPSNLDRGSATTKGVSAQLRYGEKIRKYKEEALNHNLDFIPSTFESYGLFHPSVTNLINHCCTLIASRLGVSFPMIKKYWRNRISVANLRGTARMLLTSYFEVATAATVKDMSCFHVVDRNLSIFASSGADMGD